MRDDGRVILRLNLLLLWWTRPLAAAEAAADVAVDTHAPYNHAALFHWGQVRYIQRLNSAHERLLEEVE